VVELTVGGIEFDSAHIVSWHPKCGRLHGHTYQVEVTLYGEPDKRGMIFEFGDFKKTVKEFLDGYLDHRFLVWEGFVEGFDESRVSVVWGDNDLVMTRDLVVPLKAEATIEHLADLIARSLFLRVLRLKNVTGIKVLVTEGVRKHAVARIHRSEVPGDLAEVVKTELSEDVDPEYKAARADR
jgi:6-pyruvoyltetrahydropterin/6-carboxytetrahydropterin synthase